jgi:predicted metal-dependent peptidase
MSKYQFWQNDEIKPNQNPNQNSNKNLDKSNIDRVEVIGGEVHCLDDGEVSVALMEAKLIKARTQLILDKPFLGNLVMHLPLVASDDWCKTTATDAKNFYYNPKFIGSLDSEQTKFILIHEALHCALTHFNRRGNRKKHIWDLACDFAINPLIVKEGFHAPIEAAVFKQYEGKTAEEIYPFIDDSIDNEPIDQHLYDENASDDSDESSGKSETSDDGSQNKNQQGKNDGNLASKPEPLSYQEKQDLAIKWQKDLASAAVIARQQGGLSSIMEKLVDFALQPQLSWQELLASYMSNFARDDFSFTRPKKRGTAILPTLKSHNIDIVVAVDTSGSISQEEVDEFCTEISGIKANTGAKITLLACDDGLDNNCPWEYETWDEIDFPASFGGGGGTDFNPVFDFVNDLDTPPSVVVYFTDCKGKFPENTPNYPVIWLVKGSEKIPWGMRCQLQ